MTERYYYFRDREKGFGWGVGDSKTGKVFALVNDKGYAKILADIMNGEYEESIEHAKGLKKIFDEHYV